jgi:hypothetical protein
MKIYVMFLTSTNFKIIVFEVLRHCFLFLFLIGYQVAQGFSAIQDGFDQCFPQEGVLI